MKKFSLFSCACSTLMLTSCGFINNGGLEQLGSLMSTIVEVTTPSSDTSANNSIAQNSIGAASSPVETSSSQQNEPQTSKLPVEHYQMIYDKFKNLAESSYNDLLKMKRAYVNSMDDDRSKSRIHGVRVNYTVLNRTKKNFRDAQKSMRQTRQTAIKLGYTLAVSPMEFNAMPAIEDI